MPTTNRDPIAAERGHTVAAGRIARPSVLRDYFTLTKPEITFLVTISALAGFLLGSPAAIDGGKLVVTLVGVALSAAGGCVLNHYLERGLDGEMRRTMNRPLPAGRVSAGAAARFGALLVMAGVGLLCPLTNPLTGVLAAFTVALYLFVYTPLKRKTTWNTLIGTIPGALPALGGWTAATGGFGWGGWSIFGILVAWQMPHFLSLAWMYRKDYGRARYAMLPVVEPSGRSTVLQTSIFSALLLVASVTPFVAGVSGPVYLAGAVALGAWFAVPVVAFHRSRSVPDARRVLKATVYYIPCLVALIAVDWLLRFGF